MVQETPEQKCTVYKLKEAAGLTSLTAVFYSSITWNTLPPELSAGFD